MVFDLERSRGPYLVAAHGDKELLDLCGNGGTRALGYNHPALVEQSFAECLRQAVCNRDASSKFFQEQTERFLDLFTRTTLDNQFAHVGLASCHGYAVEQAIRVALGWHNQQYTGKSPTHGEPTIVCLQQAYHGDSGLACWVSDPNLLYTQAATPRSPWPRLPNPKLRFPVDEQASKEAEEKEASFMQALECMIQESPASVAGILVEPIQVLGGNNHFRQAFFEKLRAFADEHGTLLIFDEVLTGFGTMGQWWAWQCLDVKPDIVVFGGKASVHGVAVDRRVGEHAAISGYPFLSPAAWAPHLADVVCCHKTIETIIQENLLGTVELLGRYIKRVLDDIASQFEEVTAVRTRGLCAAFDSPSPEARDGLLAACWEEDLLAMAAGDVGIRFQPALDVGAEAIGRAGAQLEAGLRRVRKGWQRGG